MFVSYFSLNCFLLQQDNQTTTQGARQVLFMVRIIVNLQEIDIRE